MSMTREEAAHILEYSRIVSENFTQEAATATYVMALAALRGPTREMVERMRGEWEWLGPCRDNKGVRWGTCSVCKTRQRLGDHLSFCPACGAPMTDEAVDMMLERWKEAVNYEG